MTKPLAGEFDAIVIGTGIAGIYAMHKLKNELGLNVCAMEKGAGVGGTWYWNRYPGARSDTESYVYRYSFDKETSADWRWDKRYADQAQMLSYLNAVVDRHGLRDDILLETTVASATYDDTGVWTVETTEGSRFRARYLVTAIGVLSRRNVPDIEGIERFKGEQVHTGAWPEGLSLQGKRVGVLGTGSTGVQFITAAAKEAAHVTVLQRSAQYCVPAGDEDVSAAFIDDYKANFEAYWNRLRDSRIACGFPESGTPAMTVSPEERRRVFEEHWQAGNGFRFMFGTFCDLAIDPAANEAACDFIREKIAQVVEDPETAGKLLPTDLYAKRPVCANGYYETYNRANVSLVDLQANPVVEATEAGVRTADGQEHVFDVLVYATGFECVEGSYREMDIHGVDGESLARHWGEKPSSYLGISVAGFPNLFMVLGPHSVFSNLAPAIETQVEWIAELIAQGERRSSTVAATGEAENIWAATCEEIAAYTLFPKVRSWIFGANIAGRASRVLFYFGGLAAYRQKLAEIASSGFDGYIFEPLAGLAPASANHSFDLEEALNPVPY